MTAPSINHQRLRKILPLLGSDQPGEVTAAAAGLIRVLTAGGMDLNDLAGLVGAELERRARPPFSFASMPSRVARKQLGILAWRPGVSLEERARIERQRAWLFQKPNNVRLPPDEIEWLDAQWRRVFGGGA